MDILEMLRGGDRRSIGKTAQVVKLVEHDHALASLLIKGLQEPDPVVRMRTADALEKLSRSKPAMIADYQEDLINLSHSEEQPEVRWHLAQILPRMPLSNAEYKLVMVVLFGYLADRSQIVLVSAIQALFDLSRNHDNDRKRVDRLLWELEQTGSPSVKARIRKLRQK